MFLTFLCIASVVNLALQHELKEAVIITKNGEMVEAREALIGFIGCDVDNTTLEINKIRAELAEATTTALANATMEINKIRAELAEAKQTISKLAVQADLWKGNITYEFISMNPIPLSVK